MPDDHNPWLNRASAGRQNNKGGPDTIEPVGGFANIEWQTRPASPSPYENALADALQRLFEDGVTELADLVVGLNRLGVEHPDGGLWTAENYPTAMKALGDAG